MYSCLIGQSYPVAPLVPLYVVSRSLKVDDIIDSQKRKEKKSGYHNLLISFYVYFT